MTNVLFNEWLAMLNKKYKLLNRKILLFVDNFSGHSCNQENFDYVRVQFFPPNLTSIIQPLDQGIINAFKMKYRKQIIIDKLECLNTSTQMKNIEIIDGINFTVQAWSEISSSTIRNCFKKAGFKMEKFLGSCSSTAKEDLNEKKHMEDMWNKIRKTETGYDFSYFEYVEVDKELNSFETYSTEDIVESILHPTDNTTSDDFDAENDVANDDRTVVDSGTAKECLKKLLEYFQSSKNDSTEHVKNLIIMNTFIANE